MGKNLNFSILNRFELQAKQDRINYILDLEERMRQNENAVIGDSDVCPLKHTFGKDIYVREIFMPKGMVIVSKIHRFKHPFFVLKGKVSVLTENGEILIEAPYYNMTLAGTKRALYIHEDTIWITVHSTKETDLEKIENEIIAKSFDDLIQKDSNILTLNNNLN